MVSKIVLIDIQVSMDLIVYNKHAFMYYLYHFLKGNRNLKKRKDVLLNNMCSVCGKDRLWLLNLSFLPGHTAKLWSSAHLHGVELTHGGAGRACG